MTTRRSPGHGYLSWVPRAPARSVAPGVGPGFSAVLSCPWGWVCRCRWDAQGWPRLREVPWRCSGVARPAPGPPALLPLLMRSGVARPAPGPPAVHKGSPACSGSLGISLVLLDVLLQPICRRLRSGVAPPAWGPPAVLRGGPACAWTPGIFLGSLGGGPACAWSPGGAQGRPRLRGCPWHLSRPP